MKTIIKKLNFEQIAEIYNGVLGKHFPPEEVKPLKNIQKMLLEGCYQVLGMYEADKVDEENVFAGLIGYAFFVISTDRDFVLLDYYAMMDEYRGQGFGSKFLAQIKREYIDCRGVLLETEDVSKASDEEQRSLRERRNRFYRGNGVKETGIRSSVYGVPYEIWIMSINGETIESSQCRSALEKIYSVMFPAEKMGKEIVIL
ncbi:MAG: GNAT family N-acetyltransferase [Lachnospiraceae bacterium]